jgi:hypothetical protein
MYNNEETRVLNQVENNPTAESRVNEDEVKNESKNELGKRAATVGSAFVGGAVGAAGAEYVQTILNQGAEQIFEEDKPDEQTVEPSSRTSTSHTPKTEVLSEEVLSEEAQPVVEDANDMPTNATLVSYEEPIADTTDTNDSEVRVVGVQAFQNEDGSQAIVAGLELDGDRALVVDVNSDGTMDLFIHDDNRDGQISDEEIHNITADNVSTQAVIDDYAVQAGQNDLYMANNDMPDYMNDADAGLMDS